MVAAITTPARNRLPIMASRRRSLKVVSKCRMSDCSLQAVKNHFDRKHRDNDCKYMSQCTGFHAGQHTSAQERATQYTDDHGHSEARIDVATLQVQTNACRGSHPDHEVTCGRRDFERDSHNLVERDYFECARSDP